MQRSPAPVMGSGSFRSRYQPLAATPRLVATDGATQPQTACNQRSEASSVAAFTSRSMRSLWPSA